MGKFLFFILLGVLLYLWLKRAPRSSPPRAAAAPPAEAMIQCAHCRIHVPLGESLADGDRRYCCEEHRRLGRR
ncbi:MAG: PP0621 family protein [Rhodocyclaceae bacterium]|nr:PP0621 family protein [Rhodocyclaceae bacterium]